MEHKTRLLLLVSVLLIGVFFSARWFTQSLLAPPLAEGAQADPAHLRIGEEFLDLLDAGRYAQALELATPDMRKVLDEARLKQVWEGLSTQFGQRKSRGSLRGEAIKGAPLVTSRLEFGSTTLDARIVVNAAGLIEGFRLVPAQAAPAEAAPLPHSTRLNERERIIDVEPRALVGALTLPRGDAAYPARLPVKQYIAACVRTVA